MQGEVVYIIDAGNSSVKVARFESNELVELKRFDLSQLDEINRFATEKKGAHVLSSVLSDEETTQLAAKLNDPFILNPSSKAGLEIHYGTKNTLGMDRLCNAVYLFNHARTEYAVCIDIGTCIKFDVVHNKEGYLGGSISPGINLRYKALNDYTGKLPLLSNKTALGYVGTDTQTSIESGVIKGIHEEISGFVDHYSERFSDLTFFMTGGDARYFDIHAKNDIFAVENLTLHGLYEIFIYNA